MLLHKLQRTAERAGNRRRGYHLLTFTPTQVPREEDRLPSPQLCAPANVLQVDKRSPGARGSAHLPSADQPGAEPAAACALRDARAQTAPRYSRGSGSFQALGKKCCLVSTEATWAEDELRARHISRV